MRKCLSQGAIASSLVLFAAQAVAVPFGAFDPRSFAMGGVGVASGTPGNAGLVNPALLAAARAEDDFALELPIGYARVADPDDFVDAADDFSNADYVSGFDQAIRQFNTLVNNAPTDPTAALLYWSNPANQTALNSAKDDLVVASEDLLDGLETLSGKPLFGEGAGAFVVGIPSKKVGMSFQATVRVAGGGIAEFSDADNDYFRNDVLAPLDAIDFTDAASLAGSVSAIENLADPNNNQLTSNLQTRFAAIAEVGVSFAREFNIAGEDVSIGITPKYVEVAVYHFGFFGNELDQADVTIDDGEKRYKDFNVDLGLAKDFGNGWKAGLTVKNLLSREYETSPNTVQLRPATIKIGPQARAGVSHQTEWVVVGLDVDLNAADPVGYEAKTQYLGLGAELNIWDTVQLRVGYRHNLKDSETSVPTVGIGFSPFGVHVDLAAAANDNEVAVSGQLGFRF